MSAEQPATVVPSRFPGRFRFRLAWLFLLMIAAAFAWNRAKQWYAPPPPLRQPFSVALLQKYRREGRPIFVQVFAPWSTGSAITRNWLDKPSSRELLASHNMVLLECDLGPMYANFPIEIVDALGDKRGGPVTLWVSGGIVLFPVGPMDRAPIRRGGDKDTGIAEQEMLIAIDRATRWP